MGSLLSRSVQIEISNNTRNISLRRPRTFLEGGRCSSPPLPELSPGSKDICTFPGVFPFSGVAGILVYESESFTLAIYFSNPIDYNQFSMELGLELSMEKVHLNPLESTYERMARGSYSSSGVDLEFHRVTLGKGHGSASISAGPVKVTATMSGATDSLLRVVLEGQDGWLERSGSGRHYQEK